MIETVSLPAVRRRSGQGLPRNRHTLALIPEPSIWALSAPATLRTRQARAATCVSTRAGPGRAPGAQACLRAHLCGVGSHGEAWQEPRCQEPRTRCPEQWEPALIGKTRQDRAWHRSQRRTNFHSPSPLFFFGQAFAGVRSGVARSQNHRHSASHGGKHCFSLSRNVLLIKSEQNFCHLHHLKVEKFKNARCFYPKTSDSFLHSFYIQPMWKKVGTVTLYFEHSVDYK